jgi:hypothetical protein
MSQTKQALYGKTIIKEHIKSFYQNAINTKAEALDITRYKYIGPAPQRPFCRSLFMAQNKRGGMGFTKQEIDLMDNGQTGDVFTTRGGYGCRHQWRPIAESAGEKVTEKQPEEVIRKLRKEKVYFGDRPPVVVRQPDGKDTGIIYRSIKKDNAGYFYKRFDGTRQPIDKEDDVFVFHATPRKVPA